MRSLTRTASAIRNETGYTGRQVDPQSGLQLNRYRYYHSPLGRWLTRDPIGYAGGDASLYGYVSSQPVLLLDPDGRIAPVVIAGALAAWWFFDGDPAHAPDLDDNVPALDDRLKQEKFGRLCDAADLLSGPGKGPAIKKVLGGLEKGTKLHRNWGKGSGPYGKSWTRDQPSAQSRDSLGLPDTNSGKYQSHGTLVDPSGAKVRPGGAKPLDGNKGGGDEVEVPNPETQIRLDAITMPDCPM